MDDRFWNCDNFGSRHAFIKRFRRAETRGFSAFYTGGFKFIELEILEVSLRWKVLIFTIFTCSISFVHHFCCRLDLMKRSRPDERRGFKVSFKCIFKFIALVILEFLLHWKWSFSPISHVRFRASIISVVDPIKRNCVDQLNEKVSGFRLSVFSNLSD